MEKKNILLVDDDDIANFLVEKVVNSTGLANHIYKALNGEEALRILHDAPESDSVPDIIFLDLNMPIMNGFEFLQAFHHLQFASKENILIVLLTSSSHPDDIEKAKSLGIRHYITKPISAETVKSIISSEFSHN